MARQTKSESKLTEAADKATAMLQDLQSRLSREAVPRREASDAASDDLDRQLREYFTAESGAADPHGLTDIRDRVIEAVADRILERWDRGDRGELGSLETQVIDRVAQRILERMTRR